MAVLGCLFRNGDLTVGELAAQERIQPPSMTRIVNALEDGGYVVRRAHETDGRQVVVVLSDAGTATLLADRARRDAWLARRLRDLSARRARHPPARRADPRTTRQLGLKAALEPHLPRPPQPQLPALRARQPGVQHRHLDAARRPGLAGPAADRRQRHRPRHHDRPAVPARPAALAVRRRGRRPLPQAPPPPAHAAHDGPRLAGARRARRHRRRAGLAGLPDRVLLRDRLGVRRAGPPVVRLRDGRPRRPDQRRRASTPPRSTPHASSARPWPG